MINLYISYWFIPHYITRCAHNTKTRHRLSSKTMPNIMYNVGFVTDVDCVTLTAVTGQIFISGRKRLWTTRIIWTTITKWFLSHHSFDTNIHKHWCTTCDTTTRTDLVHWFNQYLYAVWLIVLTWLCNTVHNVTMSVQSMSLIVSIIIWVGFSRTI